MLNDMNQAQQQRLAFIDFCLQYYGQVGRAELIQRFNTGVAAATRDFSSYRQLAPDNLELKHQTKNYHRKDGFKPLFDHAPEALVQFKRCPTQEHTKPPIVPRGLSAWTHASEGGLQILHAEDPITPVTVGDSHFVFAWHPDTAPCPLNERHAASLAVRPLQSLRNHRRSDCLPDASGSILHLLSSCYIKCTHVD